MRHRDTESHISAGDSREMAQDRGQRQRLVPQLLALRCELEVTLKSSPLLSLQGHLGVMVSS